MIDWNQASDDLFDDYNGRIGDANKLRYNNLLVSGSTILYNQGSSNVTRSERLIPSLYHLKVNTSTNKVWMY